MASTIYECEPIGMGPSLEAVAVHYFCNSTCRSAWSIPSYTRVRLGEDNEWIDGTVCERCGKPLTRPDTVFVNTSLLHETTLSIEQRLLHALYTNNWEPRAYSGRGMFGAQCVAVSLTGESQLWQLARTVPVDVDAPHTDQLGKGLIAYWPNYEWPKDEGKAMPWCEPCGSYHHSTAPGCRAEHGPLLHFNHP